MSSFPLIGVSACTKLIGLHPAHIVADKYVRAVAVAAPGIPVVIPALAEVLALPELLARLDGVLLTGSPSNVEPHHYHGMSSAPGTEHDVFRDNTTLPLIRLALDMGVPLLGICRGFQEINVALGGSLHQCVHEVSGLMDHREAEGDLETQYQVSHPLLIQPGGLLEKMGLADKIKVNSLHGQGVDRLAPGLRVEAVAEDGLIEAFSVIAAPGFALGVQWHPEWQVLEHPDYTKIFRAFGAACQARAEQRSF